MMAGDSGGQVRFLRLDIRELELSLGEFLRSALSARFRAQYLVIAFPEPPNEAVPEALTGRGGWLGISVTVREREGSTVQRKLLAFLMLAISGSVLAADPFVGTWKM